MAVQLSLDLPEPSATSPPPETARVVELERPESWSDEGIDEFVTRFFQESVHELLDGRSGEATRAEIRAWIVRETLGPLSFRTCCAVLGYNPQAMREAIEQQEAVRERTRRHRTVEGCTAA